MNRAITSAIKERANGAAPVRPGPRVVSRGSISPLVRVSHNAGVAGSSPAPAICRTTTYAISAFARFSCAITSAITRGEMVAWV